MGSKLEEANDWIGKAEKRFSLKTSLFKRTPDYDSAIEYYTKAALLFRSAKQSQKAAELYTKMAELNFKLNSYYHCAKNYETASTLYKELDQFDKMVALVSQAGELLQKGGVPDSAAYVYERAAKSLDKQMPEQAAKFYEAAAEADEIEDKFHEAADAVSNAARLWVRARRLTEAERALRRYIDYCQRGNPDSIGASIGGLADSAAVPKLCARGVIVLILIKLHRGDEVAANKIYSEAVQCWRFNETDDNLEVRRLLAAVEGGDSAAALQAVKSPSFRNLELDYVRLLKEIKFPQTEEEIETNEDDESRVDTQETVQDHHPVPQTIPTASDPTIGVHQSTEEPDAAGDDDDEENVC